MPSLSRSLEQALHRTIRLATQRHHEYATLEHLLLSLIDDGDAAQVMRACNVDLDTLRASVTKYIDEDLATLTIQDEEDAKPTTGFQRVVQRAVLHVQNSGRDEVTGANVLVSLYSERDAHAVYSLQKQQMSRQDAVNYMSHGIAKRADMSQPKPPRPKAPALPDELAPPDYAESLRSLIERWCDQRHLRALCLILPVYLAMSGLTDSWQDLHDALKSTRALGQEAFTAGDWDAVNELIRGAERIIYLR